MEVRKGEGGHRQFVLGPVEIGIASTIPALLLMLLAFQGTGVVSQLGKQGEAIGQLREQLAVANTQLQTLTEQLADVPSLRRDVAELQVQVRNHGDEIKELRRVRE